MIAKEGVDLALIVSTAVLTHATYRAVPTEHKHRVRREIKTAYVTVTRVIPVLVYRYARWCVCWVIWTVTTPVRRREHGE